MGGIIIFRRLASVAVEESQISGNHSESQLAVHVSSPVRSLARLHAHVVVPCAARTRIGNGFFHGAPPLTPPRAPSRRARSLARTLSSDSIGLLLDGLAEGNKWRLERSRLSQLWS